jgi:RND family efflux transporter MFP subunit
MNMNKQYLLKLIGPVVLVVAIVGAVVFVKTKPKAQRKQMSSMIPVVEVADIQKINAPVKVECMGTVIADSVAEVQAEVRGLVQYVHSDLTAGAFVLEGELLVEIDPRDYEQAVRSAQAALKTAQSNLRIEEGRQATAKHEMELIGGSEIDEAYRDLMLRAPQLEVVEASVEAAEAALASAQAALERTKIRAPFDAVVQMENIDVGDYASVGRTLLELVSTDRFFVRASVPVSDLKFVPMIGKKEYAARLIAADEAERTGTLYKLLPRLTEQGRMARLLIAVDQPMAADHVRPMLLGESVRVELSGREQENVFVIQRRYLRDGSVVWMMDPDHKLRICPAEVIRGYTGNVMVRFEFPNDWKMVTSNMAAPVDGMQLKTQDELPEGRP